MPLVAVMALWNLVLACSSSTMATLLYQRAGWTITISRTSRHFSISFATRLPHQRQTRHRVLESLPRTDAYGSSRSSLRAAARAFSTSHSFAQDPTTAAEVRRLVIACIMEHQLRTL